MRSKTISESCGYGTAESLRRAFQRSLRVTPGARTGHDSSGSPGCVQEPTGDDTKARGLLSRGGDSDAESRHGGL
jgi:AraC-like DNA-binding protein